MEVHAVNERAEFLKLFLEQEGNLRAFIGSLLRDWHASEDVLQEVALTAWERFDDFNRQRPFGAWARGIAANKILKRREQTARFPLLFSPETVQGILDAFERADRSDSSPRAEALAPCIEQLPDSSRQLLTLRYGEGLVVAQVAERLHSTPDAIYKNLLRIRARLRDCVRARLAAATKDNP